MDVRSDVKLSRFCEREKSLPCGFVIFGASGDLAGKKLFPSLFRLYSSASVPDAFFIAGFSRTSMNDNAFRDRVRSSILEVFSEAGNDILDAFLSRCFFESGNYDRMEDYKRLRIRLEELGHKYATGGNIVYNLAVPPDLYGIITEKLVAGGLIRKGLNREPFQRVMMEKPFGHDLESAVRLNSLLLENLEDEQVYRIDHYLGKNTVQNIIVFRFANAIFEPVWNRSYIDHVQITLAENIGLENRAGYFEKAGLVRDMLQNHMMQLLALIAMEEPLSLDSGAIINEKVKVFSAIKPFDMAYLQNSIIRGQYTGGEIDGEAVPAYRDEIGVDKNSCTETYFAVKMSIDNEKWKGVPFYLRAGKRLEKKMTAIHVVFRDDKDCLFCKTGIDHNPDILRFGIQPQQELSLKFNAKVPGPKFCLSPLDMTFNYRDLFGADTGGDYENVILDCLNGDQTIFWNKEGIEESWKLLTPVLREWEECSNLDKNKRLYFYKAGTGGPPEADEFIQRDGRFWI